nr:MAG TPA: hypothetical protein [Bacteriophage sp.]
MSLLRFLYDSVMLYFFFNFRGNKNGLFRW